MVRYLVKLIGRVPKTAIIAALITAAAGGGAGVYLHAQREWHNAQTAEREGRHKDAQEHVKACLYFWPRDVAVRLLAARAFRLTGDFESAENHLNECLRIQRGASEEVQLEFMLMRVQRGEVDEVAPDLLLLVDKQHPESALILETCAAAYMYNHRYRPALKCLDRWTTQAPNAARAYQWRGWVYEQMNARHDAMKEYEQALQFDPELVPVRLRLAEMLLNEKQPLEALPLLERLRAQFPDRPDVLARLGQCRYLQGQTEEARRLLTTAVVQLPDDSQLLLHLGKLELEDAHPVEAERWLRRAIAADPGGTEPLFALQSCLELQGRKQEAADALKKHQEIRSLLEQANRLLREEAETPSYDAKTVHQIGELLLEIGQNRLALYWLHQALNRDPSYQPTHKLLADYYQSQKDERNAALHRARLREPERKSPSDAPTPDKNIKAKP